MAPWGAFVGFWLGGFGSLFGGFLLMAAYVHGSSRVSIRALLTLLSPLPFWVLGPLAGVAVGAPIGAPTGFLAALYDGAVGGIATILFMAAMVVISITEGRRSLNA